MPMPRLLIVAMLVFIPGLCQAAAPETQPETRPAAPVDSADVDAAVKPLIDGQWCIGVTVGLVDARGKRVWGYGKIGTADAASDRAPDGRTIYEIGSVSKTFTALLLAEMVVEKQMSLDDPAQRYLPDSVKLPPRDSGAGNKKPMPPITLLNLATQRSGLPRMPDNFKPKDPLNPYADYSVEQMYDFLSRYELTRAPGAQYEYSNLGVGLLGHLLSLKAGEPYEQLLVKRICSPLEMNDTRITLNAEQKSRLSPGYDADLNPQPNWDIPTFAGAGAIRSTADDMLKYVAAQIGLTALEPGMTSAVALSHEIRANVEEVPDTRIALAWHVDTRHGVYWHNGQTGGYHSFIAFSPEVKVGVVVLANTGIGAIDGVGRNLIAKEIGYAETPLKLPASPKLDVKVMDRYVGQYLMAPGLVATITREGDKLYVRLTGQPKARIYPKSETEFYWKVAPARATFTVDDKGNATKMVLHQGGRDLPGLRVHPEVPLE